MKTENRGYSAKSNKDNEETILQKLPFRIIEVSSEEEGYPVTELLNHTPFSRGWQSSRFCDYPQEIVIEFPSVVTIRQIQFLSHQYKISSKIEIYIDIPNQKKFKKIGYLGLDPNDKSNFQARELKSVYVNYQVSKMKVCLNRCHTNIHNNFSQVGLIALNVLGEYNNKSGDNVNMNNYIGGEGVGAKLEEEMNYDPVTLKRLKLLYKAKEKAIELEDFDEAKKIKAAIERLKGVSNQLIQLEERKRIAIKNDDFDAAKMLKYEVERLRNAVAGIQIGGEVEMKSNHYSSSNKVQPKKPFLIREDQEFQNEMDEIPMGKEKLKLLPVKKEFHDQIPLTNDMLMDEEDNINMTKKVNPNEGYKLKTRDKPVENVDDQVIKGINKDFSDIVNEKLQKESGGKNVIKNNPEDVEEDIPASEYKKAEPLIPVLGYDIVKQLFSKQWRNKEEGIKALIEEIKSYPNSKLLSQHGVDQILTAVVGASAYVLQCTISQALMATMDMLKILFNKFRGNNIQGYTRNDFDSYVDQCLLLLIEKVGDTNLKLKEKSENTVMEFANSTLVGHKTVFEALIAGQVKKTLVKSAKHLSGRLNLISRMIDNFGLNTKDVPLDPLMGYAINGFKDPNKEVRDAAFNVIMNVFKFIGDNVRKYFKDLRPAQVNILEEGFENLDGLNQVDNNKQDDFGDDGQEFMNESKMIYKGKNTGGGGGGNSSGKTNSNSNSNANANVNNKNKNKNQNYEDEDAEYDQNPNPNQNFNDQMNKDKDNSASCGFCGYFDPNFDEDALYLHCYRECPMLALCFKCKQIVEISALNYHYQNECQAKKEFRQCTRCKEAIHQNEYNQHVAEKMCIPAKNPNVANRCPLCHTDHTPAGKVGWEVHLLQNTCSNNPRTMA